MSDSEDNCSTPGWSNHTMEEYKDCVQRLQQASLRRRTPPLPILTRELRRQINRQLYGGATSSSTDLILTRPFRHTTLGRPVNRVTLRSFRSADIIRFLYNQHLIRVNREAYQQEQRFLASCYPIPRNRVNDSEEELYPNRRRMQRKYKSNNSRLEESRWGLYKRETGKVAKAIRKASSSSRSRYAEDRIVPVSPERRASVDDRSQRSSDHEVAESSSSTESDSSTASFFSREASIEEIEVVPKLEPLKPRKASISAGCKMPNPDYNRVWRKKEVTMLTTPARVEDRRDRRQVNNVMKSIELPRQIEERRDYNADGISRLAPHQQRDDYYRNVVREEE